MYQLLKQMQIFRVTEPAGDTRRHYRTDVVHRFEIFLTRGADALEFAVGSCQVGGRGLPHLANAEAMQQARQGGGLAALDSGNNIGRRFFTHALQGGELLQA